MKPPIWTAAAVGDVSSFMYAGPPSTVTVSLCVVNLKAVLLIVEGWSNKDGFIVPC